MIISAKYPSKCSCCLGQISVGSQIEWEKGKPVRHVSCGGKGASGARGKEARGAWSSRGGAWNGCSMGCREGNPNPRCKQCMFDEFDC
jgi:hypothetical protein